MYPWEQQRDQLLDFLEGLTATSWSLRLLENLSKDACLSGYSTESSVIEQNIEIENM